MHCSFLTARPSTEIPLTEKPSTEITSIPDVTESDQLNQKLTVYKKALIGVSVGAGILLIVLIFYVMYLNDEKTNMESSQPKKGLHTMSHSTIQSHLHRSCFTPPPAGLFCGVVLASLYYCFD